MELHEAQAIIREHGLEDFPRPWIFEMVGYLQAGYITDAGEGGYIDWKETNKIIWPAGYGHFWSCARETALLMGWKPKGESDGYVE